MNPNIEKLYQIASKKERIIIGLMSGTSLDGLDIAVATLSGHGTNTGIKLLHFVTVPYSSEFKKYVTSIFSKKNVDLEMVCLLNEWIGLEHGKMILQSLDSWNLKPGEIDIIASHGQTIYHAPKTLHKNKFFGNGTLQIGDGDHIAVSTGIITISDFRQKHIAAGGEGAPLAAYGDYLIFGQPGENRILLNIGGIANFTFLPASLNRAEIFSTDTGPGNTMMDAFTRKYFKKEYDANAELAEQGKVIPLLLIALEDHPFFFLDFPKTTGPELFNLEYLEAAKIKANCTDISPYDCLRTLNQFSANQIGMALQKTMKDTGKLHIFSSGGGMHNPLLMKNIKKILPEANFYTTDKLGMLPDAKEALLFALLANETVAGNQHKHDSTNDIPDISMGKISFPV